MSSLKRVLLIHTDGNTFNNPTLKCVVDLLLDHGVAVTIRYPASPAPMPQLPGITCLPFGRLYRAIKSLIFNRLCSKQLSWLSVWFERIFLYEKYDLVIGVDRQGLIESGLLFKMTGTPFVFFSFEIMFESETSAAFKSLERSAAQFVRQWFVQDELRARHLQRENSLDPATRSILPLASSGPGMADSVRLRDRLGVPLERKVAITMGSLSAWSMTREIISSVTAWPDDWVLVVHERYGQTTKTLEALGLDPGLIPEGKVYLSSHATTMVDGMGGILAGVSAGLAFYRPDYSGIYTGKNLEYLGLASGKISTFMRYGVPTVMNEVGLYSVLAREHGFGLVAKDAANIGTLLPLLADSSWGESARRFYDVHLDFANYRDSVWEKLLEAEKTY
jgi:hypothetical protein